MALHEQSSTRRAFFKVVGALTSFALFVKCKTVGAAASEVMADALDPAATDFMAASKALTGFATLDNGLANQYYADMKATHGDDNVQAMVDAYKQIAAAGGNVEEQIKDKIMGNEAHAKVAGAAIMLWYWGTFNKITPGEPVAVKAYQKGLVWQTFKGKPMGVPDEAEGVWGVEPAQ